jgi:predicted transcriptional regulator with HTH domain
MVVRGNNIIRSKKMSELKIKALQRQNEELSERISSLEYRLALLSEDSNVNRLLSDFKINYREYRAIVDLMKGYENILKNDGTLSYEEYEISIYNITEIERDIEFARLLAMAFTKDRRFSQVFDIICKGWMKLKPDNITKIS